MGRTTARVVALRLLPTLRGRSLASFSAWRDSMRLRKMLALSLCVVALRRHRGRQCGAGFSGPYQRHRHRQHRRGSAGRHGHRDEPGADSAAGAGHRRRRRLSLHRVAAGRLRRHVRAVRFPDRQARRHSRRHQPDADRRPAAAGRDAAGNGHGDRRIAGRRHVDDAGRHQLHQGAADRNSERARHLGGDGAGARASR